MPVLLFASKCPPGSENDFNILKYLPSLENKNSVKRMMSNRRPRGRVYIDNRRLLRSSSLPPSPLAGTEPPRGGARSAEDYQSSIGLFGWVLFHVSGHFCERFSAKHGSLKTYFPIAPANFPIALVGAFIVVVGVNTISCQQQSSQGFSFTQVLL